MTAVLDNDWACGVVQIRNRYKQNLRCAAGGLPFYCRSICIYISYFPCVLGRKKGVLCSIYYTKRFYRKRPPVYATSFVVD